MSKNKIVPFRPDFTRELTHMVEKNFDLAQSGSDVQNEMWSPELRAFLDAQTLKSLFFSEDWVYIVVDLVANKISSQPLQVLQTVGDETEPAPGHPLNALLKQPNEWQDYAQFMYNLVVELTLMGNAVIWHAPKSGQLITLQTENITINFDQRGAVSSYVVGTIRDDGTGLIIANENSQHFDPDEIMHVRRPNPSSLLWGLSPFIPGRKSILFNRYSADYLNAFYLKQATPGLALSLDRNVNEDVALRQLRSFEAAYQGRKNQRRTLILPKGVDAKALTHSLSDQKLIEHIELNREIILGLLKVPKHELSLQSAGSLGSEEHKTSLRNFWESTLIPCMRLIEGSLNKFFAKELGEGHRFEFDLSGVEALRDDLNKKAEIAAKMLQAGLSINEVRQKIWKEEAAATPKADEPFVLASIQQPVSPFSLPLPEPEPEPEQLSVKISFTPELENYGAAVQKQLADEESRTVKTLGNKAIEILVGMTEKAVDVMLAADKQKALPPKKELERRIRQALAGQFEEEWVMEIARTLSTSIELGYNQQLELIFNAEAKREIEILKERDSRRRRQLLEARGIESFDQISKTHTERIMTIITDSVEKGEAIGTTARRIAESLGTPGQLAGKAETIARTETLTAVSIGQAAAMNNAKEVIPGLKKGWMTAGDDRVRDSHVVLNGEVVDADETFSNGLGYPRDTRGDAGDIINCRCSLILLPPGEDLEIPR